MSKSKYYQYFVEGKTEEKIVNVLKTDLQVILPGKVQVFNVVQQELTKLRLMSLKKDTTVILIFDTDTGSLDILQYNLDFLHKEKSIKEVICITQVENLEDELVRSCNVKNIKELTNSKSNKEFKHDMIKDSKFAFKLKNKCFDINIFWSSNPKNQYKIISNKAYKIKK